MSVVPLILDKSIVDTQNAFQNGGGVHGRAMLVLSLERSQLLSTTSSNVSYDLRVGSKYRGYRNPNDTDLGVGKEILLRAGDAVLIQTEETVHVPQSLFGYVVPKVGLLQSGLSNTLSKVDPGYRGPLVITLFNLGVTDQKVKRGDPFCALVLHRVDIDATLYDKAAKQILGNPPTEPWPTRAKAWVERNTWWISLVSVLLGLFAGGLAGAIFTFMRSKSH